MRSLPTRMLAVAALAIASACDRSVTAPAPAGAEANYTILGSPATVNVVQRTTPLATPLTASAVIGVLGGQLSIPAAGIKVVVPAFALTAPTRITVRAVAGSQVAYEFEPHGTRFLVPLTVSQSLVGTDAYPGSLLNSSLVAGYFRNLSDLDPLAGTGLVTELLGVAINLNTKTATFPVFHFSGYLVATGESDAGISQSQ